MEIATAGQPRAPAPNGAAVLFSSPLFSSLLFSGNTCSRLCLAGVFPLFSVSPERGRQNGRKGAIRSLLPNQTGLIFVARAVQFKERSNKRYPFSTFTSDTTSYKNITWESRTGRGGSSPWGPSRCERTEGRGGEGREGAARAEHAALTHSCRAHEHTLPSSSPLSSLCSVKQLWLGKSWPEV